MKTATNPAGRNRPEAVEPPVERAADAGADRRAALQTWRGKAISENIFSRSLDAAYRRWLFHGTGRRPRLRDLIDDAKPFEQTLLALKIADDFLIVDQSPGYIDGVGRDMRGMLTSELKFATANSLRELYDESLANNYPIYARFISSLSNRNSYWEVMILPLASDERGSQDLIMSFMSVLSEKADLLRVLYDRSPTGIVAAVPIMDGRNRSDDARILTLNVRAREILNIPEQKAPPHSVGELIKYLTEVLHWSAISSSTAEQSTTIQYQDDAQKRFAMSIELMNHFVLISFTAAATVAADAPARTRFARLLGIS
jgi:hypothetical protein